MTRADVFFNLVRPIFYFCTLAFTYYGFRMKYPNVHHIYVWLIALLFLTFFYVMARVLVRCLFGLRHIGVLDELQLYDMSRNKAIITCALYFDKFHDSTDGVLKKMQ